MYVPEGKEGEREDVQGIGDDNKKKEKKKEHNARLDEEPDNNSRGGRRGGGRTAALTLVWTWFVLDCVFDCFV